MTSSTTGPMVPLATDESWALLSSRSLGRLATSVSDVPDIFPVNFVIQHHTVLIRTAEGTKLAAASVNQHVAFEADDHDVSGGWSVVVKGIATVLDDAAEIADAERAQLLPWITSRKPRFIRVVPTTISGRRFEFGGEADDVLDAL